MKNTNCKKTMMSNIIYILMKEGRKMEDLESAIGVPSGYFMGKCKQSDSEMDLNVVCSLAKELHVSSDTLLGADLSGLSERVKERISMLDKLNRETKNEKLNWERESAVFLRNAINNYYGDGHALFEERTFMDYDEEGRGRDVTRNVFPSFAYDVYTDIWGDCFRLSLGEDAALYLMSVRGRDPLKNEPVSYAKEIWISTQRGEKEFICSNQDIPVIAKLVDSLYSEVRDNAMHAGMSLRAKSLLQSFVKTDMPDEEIDI